jgi:hypothetical protein
MGAIDRLVAKFATITVTVPPHVRVRNGQREDVDGYTYERDVKTGREVPGSRKELTAGDPDGSSKPKAVEKLKAKKTGGTVKKPAPSKVVERPEGVTAGSGTKEDPWMTAHVESAAAALGRGEYVQLDQPRQVSTLLNKLAAIVDDAKKKGDQAPLYDLCKVTVAKTNLFCVESKGIPRVQMPQLAGKPLPDSRAAKEVKADEEGEVDLAPMFMEYLEKEVGFDVSEQSLNPAHLRASQIELEGGKVAGMARAMEQGMMKKGFIWATRDDYVIDGHHRWAAQVGYNIAHDENDNVEAHVVDADIITVLNLANEFTERMGMPHADIQGKQYPELKVGKFS